MSRGMSGNFSHRDVQSTSDQFKVDISGVVYLEVAVFLFVDIIIAICQSTFCYSINFQKHSIYSNLIHERILDDSQNLVAAAA